MPTIEPWEVFVARTRSVRAEDFAEELGTAARRWALSPEQSVAEFELMRAHVLQCYEGVHPLGSFLTSDGIVVDCIPFEEQPTVRTARAAGNPVVLTAPPPTRSAAGTGGAASLPNSSGVVIMP